MCTSPGLRVRGGSGLRKAIPSTHPAPNFGRVFGGMVLVLNVLLIVLMLLGKADMMGVFFLLPGVLFSCIFWRRNKVLVSLLCLLFGLTVLIGFTV